jgi:hypothetical protein
VASPALLAASAGYGCRQGPRSSAQLPQAALHSHLDVHGTQDSKQSNINRCTSRMFAPLAEAQAALGNNHYTV